ncbi:MAG: 30S ribosomal protein S17 [Candidatus Riflebacteria bacterium]|nr:30S ribosomal protein S17 [Candidatus Riflebacteria bacterium]
MTEEIKVEAQVEAQTKAPAQAKVRGLVGEVVSTATQKTAVVQVERLKKHPLYKKTIKRHKRYMAHDETSVCAVGDVVEIVPSRPLSRRKRWAVLRVVEKAE